MSCIPYPKSLKTFFVIFYISTFVQAQESPSSFKGKLQNQEGDPIAFASIAIHKPDSTILMGEISDENGEFTLINIQPGSYYTQIQSVEYSTLRLPLDLQPGKELNIGTITMKSGTLELEGVVVEGKKQVIEVLPDKMVFNVESSVNSSGLNGLELLAQAPGVLVDPDNNVILQGKSGVRIFINGRPSRLSGNDLATFLQSMQSDNIELIELITNPSAKYEAEGNAGIINIKLKNNVNLGYNGSLIHSFSKGHEPRMNNSATINYGKRKLRMTAGIARFDDTYIQEFIDRNVQNGFQIDRRSVEIRKRYGYNVNTSITYTLNKNHSINLSGGMVLTTGDDDAISNSSILNLADPQQEEILIAKSLTNFTSSNYNGNFNYNWDISEKASISTDVSYGKFFRDNHIYQPNTYYESDGETAIREVNTAYDPYTDIDIYSIKADYTHKFERFNLSAGTKYYEVLTDNDFVVSDVVNEAKTLNDSLSNIFTYSEKVGAAYAMIDMNITDKLKINAGLRVEQTHSEGILKSLQQIENDNVKREYLNFFPNVSAAYSYRKSEMSIGYGKRITRPNYQYLNPFETKTSELIIWKGNPFLNPRYITNYQFTYSYDNKLVISNTFSVEEGFFARILRIVDDTKTVIEPQNMRRSTTNGLSVNYPLTITDFWESSFFVIYNRTTYNGKFDDANIDIKTNIYNVRIQNSFKLPWDMSMNISGFYSSPFIWRGSVEIDYFYRIDVGIKRDFFQDKLQVRLTGADILNTGSAFRYYGNYGGIEIDGTYKPDNSRFGFGLTYKFGNKNIKSQKRKGGLSEQLDRISE